MWKESEKKQDDRKERKGENMFATTQLILQMEK